MREEKLFSNAFSSQTSVNQTKNDRISEWGMKLATLILCLFDIDVFDVPLTARPTLFDFQ